MEEICVLIAKDKRKYFKRYDFSRKIIDTALKIEKDPSLLHTYLPDEPYPELFIAREDRLLHHLARNIGKEQVRIGTEPQVIYGWQYRSVMRNQNYVKH